MISQPMNGLSDVEILRKKVDVAFMLRDQGHEVLNTFFGPLDPIEKSKNEALFLLGKSLQEMSRCDAVYFCKGWEEARGCLVEHRAALNYGLKVEYEV